MNQGDRRRTMTLALLPFGPGIQSLLINVSDLQALIAVADETSLFGGHGESDCLFQDVRE